MSSNQGDWAGTSSSSSDYPELDNLDVFTNTNSNSALPDTPIESDFIENCDPKDEQDKSSSCSQPSFDVLKVSLSSSETKSDVDLKMLKAENEKTFRANATLGYKSFLKNVNYVSHNNHFLNEKLNHSISNKQTDALKDYMTLSPDMVPGYVLLERFNSSIELSDLYYHATKVFDPHSPSSSSGAIEQDGFQNNYQVPVNTKVIIRLSPNMLRSVPLSRFLNEWYILSGLNVPQHHRVFGNDAISNKYFGLERSSKLDFRRSDIYQPVTLPRDLPGVLYPVKVLTISDPGSLQNYLSGIDLAASGIEEVDLLNGVTVPKPRNDSVSTHSVHSKVSGGTSHSDIQPDVDSTVQSRLAMVYLDNDYKTLKECFEEDGDNLSEQLGSGRNKSTTSLNSSRSSEISNAPITRPMSSGYSGYSSAMSIGNSLFDEIHNKIQRSPKTPLKVVAILSAMLKVLETLATVHEFGIVHNGINSSVILKSNTDNNDVKLSGWDFCFSIQPEDSTYYFRKRHLVQIPELLPYLSPEICGEANKGLDYRSDFYSIGIVLYELLVGCTPFASNNPNKIIRRHLTQTPIAPSLVAHAWITPELSDIIMRCLEKDPNDRYNECYSLMNDLRKVKNKYIASVSDLGESVLKCWSKNDEYRDYLVEEPENQDFHKYGVSPCFTESRNIYGQEEIYEQVFDAYDNMDSGVNLLFINGVTGSGLTTLINDLKSASISSSDHYISWKFNSSSSSGSVYTCFLHGIKHIVNQIMSSSPEVVSKWRDLVITKIPIDLSILFTLIPEMKTFLGPTYTTVIESDPRIKNETNDRSISLELKFRYIIKSFYCLIGYQGLTMFLDDIQWCSLSEWSMLSEILNYFQSEDSTEEVSIRIVAGYSTEPDSRSDTSNVSKEDLLGFLKDSKVVTREFKLEPISLDSFTQYVNDAFTVAVRGGGTLSNKKSGNTSMSSMYGSSSSPSTRVDDSVKEVAAKIYKLTNKSVLMAKYLIATASLNGLIRFANNLDTPTKPRNTRKANQSTVRSKHKVVASTSTDAKSKKWILDMDKLTQTIKGDIIKNYLNSALSAKAKAIMSFASITADGYFFHLSQLMIVSNLSLKEVYELLHLCVETGVIMPTSNYYKIPFHLMVLDEFPFDLSDGNIWELATKTRYRFCHDSVQSQLIKELRQNNTLQDYHKLCGLRYYKRISKSTEVDITNYLQMAYHLRKSTELIAKDVSFGQEATTSEKALAIGIKPDELDIYRRVLIQAGRYASSTYNNTAALEFFKAADLLLDYNDNLKKKMKSVLTICQTYQELKLFQECLDFIKETQSKYHFDETVFLLSKVKSLFQLGEFEQGLKTAVDGLKNIGIDIDYDNDKCKKLYDKLYPKVPISILDIRRLNDLKKATNPIILLVYELIFNMLTPSYATSNKYIAKCLVVQAVMLIYHYGVSAHCSGVLLEFANGFARMNDKSNMLKAIEYCKAALNIVDRMKDDTTTELVKNVYEFYVYNLAVLIEPIPNLLKYHDVFIQSAKPFVRNHNYAPVHILRDSCKGMLNELSGHPVDDKPTDFSDLSNVTGSTHIVLGCIGLLMNGDISLDTYESKLAHLTQNKRYLKLLILSVKIKYLSMHEMFNQAKDLILYELDSLEKSFSLGVLTVNYDFCCAIVLTNCEYNSEHELKQGIDILARIYRSFQLWSELVPSTFESKFSTIQALMSIKRTGVSPSRKTSMSLALSPNEARRKEGGIRKESLGYHESDRNSESRPESRPESRQGGETSAGSLSVSSSYKDLPSLNTKNLPNLSREPSSHTTPTTSTKQPSLVISPEHFAQMGIDIKKVSQLEILDLFDEAIEQARDNNNWSDLGVAAKLCARWLAGHNSGQRRVTHYVKTALEVFGGLDGKLATSLLERRFSKYLDDEYNWAGVKRSASLPHSLKIDKTPDEYQNPLGDALDSFFDARNGEEYKNKGPKKGLVRRKSIKNTKVERVEKHPRFVDESPTDLNVAIQACLSISESNTDATIALKLLESSILFMGVDYGVVVLRDNNEPFIQAIGSANNVYLVDNQPLSSRGDICPFTLILHVLQTGEIVNKNEDHIKFSTRFIKDDYYQHNNCSTMICIPLQNQFGVFGALYLENQKPLQKNTNEVVFFNTKKKDMVTLLCTQAAVSIGKVKLYKQMEIAKKAAEDATAEKASFLANMSHEIRTPFNSLLSCSIFLLDTDLTKTQREYVETIKSSAMVTLNIIDGILAFSKIEHGSFTLDNAPFSLTECIESSMQSSGEQAAANDLELVFLNRCQNIESVVGDITRFRQIIINLVGNAIKFTPTGAIVVEARAVEITPNRHEISIYVEDSGIGIPEEAKNKVFGAFSQVDGSSRRVFGGSGLGLAISKKLADIMGGDLGFVSTEGVGSTFHFILSSEVILKKQPEINFASDKLKHLGIKSKVLIIDNHQYSIESLAETMEYFGMEVTTWDQVTESDPVNEYSFIFIHESQYTNLKKRGPVTNDKCKIVVIASFGKSLPKDIENHSVLLTPFQRSKLIRIIQQAVQEQYPKNIAQLVINEYTLTEDSTFSEMMAKTHPLRILLAEDNLVNTKVALQHLKKLGYQADHAKDGVEVLERCNELLQDNQYYDVILMDIQMPRKDGIEATIELNKLFTDLGIKEKMPKIVALTANVAGDDREKSLSCGMVDFISKPVIPSELIRVLKSLASPIQDDN